MVTTDIEISPQNALQYKSRVEWEFIDTGSSETHTSVELIDSYATWNYNSTTNTCYYDSIPRKTDKERTIPVTMTAYQERLIRRGQYLLL